MVGLPFPVHAHCAKIAPSAITLVTASLTTREANRGSDVISTGRGRSRALGVTTAFDAPIAQRTTADRGACITKRTNKTRKIRSVTASQANTELSS